MNSYRVIKADAVDYYKKKTKCNIISFAYKAEYDTRPGFVGRQSCVQGRAPLTFSQRTTSGIKDWLGFSPFYSNKKKCCLKGWPSENELDNYSQS